jgi:hypothetical protein
LLHEVHLLLCPSKILRHGNKNTLFLGMENLVLFYNVFKALNLFLNKYKALAALYAPEALHRVLTWLGIGD